MHPAREANKGRLPSRLPVWQAGACTLPRSGPVGAERACLGEPLYRLPPHGHGRRRHRAAQAGGLLCATWDSVNCNSLGRDKGCHGGQDSRPDTRRSLCSVLSRRREGQRGPEPSAHTARRPAGKKGGAGRANGRGTHGEAGGAVNPSREPPNVPRKESQPGRQNGSGLACALHPKAGER